ncbi:MAG TPA: DUF2865 domain-containing protein [Saliniramus sp.]|nr:DUF2865 domain-containing protein [Saliniramus sp.]
MTGSRILSVAAICVAALASASSVQAQSARQTAEMTARGCVIRSDATGRYWACPPGALQQTGNINGQANQTQQQSRRSGGSRARNFCVRTCDGYFFPLDGLEKKGDEARQSACNTACPGSETVLYSTRPGEEIDDARTVGDSRRYGELEIAFMHRLKRVEGCTCRRSDGASPVEAARNDETLRRGDIIVTQTGMEVYQGASQFVDYREADSIGRSMREALTRRLELSQR